MSVKKALVSDFVNQLQEQVSNHSIYVWGASGQLCKDVNEAWIRKQESKNSGGKYADEAVKKWKEVMDSPYKSVARCFDCSGYVSYCLMQIGAADKRRDCDGIYARCQRETLSDKPRNGTLLFRVNAENPEDETHVGVYCSGYQFHAKGRSYGVVKEKFSKKYWAKAGWYNYLEEDVPSPSEEPTEEPTDEPKTPTNPSEDSYVLVLGSVRVRNIPSSVKSNTIYIAHTGNKLPYLGETEVDDRGNEWYFVNTPNGKGYISAFTNAKRKHTKLVIN